MKKGIFSQLNGKRKSSAIILMEWIFISLLQTALFNKGTRNSVSYMIYGTAKEMYRIKNNQNNYGHNSFIIKIKPMYRNMK